MRNLAFTCDLCGRQFDRDDEGSTLSLRPLSLEVFNDNIIKFDYDFCENCARSIGAQVKKFLLEKGVKRS